MEVRTAFGCQEQPVGARRRCSYLCNAAVGVPACETTTGPSRRSDAGQLRRAAAAAVSPTGVSGQPPAEVRLPDARSRAAGHGRARRRPRPSVQAKGSDNDRRGGPRCPIANLTAPSAPRPHHRPRDHEARTAQGLSRAGASPRWRAQSIAAPRLRDGARSRPPPGPGTDTPAMPQAHPYRRVVRPHAATARDASGVSLGIPQRVVSCKAIIRAGRGPAVPISGSTGAGKRTASTSSRPSRRARAIRCLPSMTRPS
jgi:hypothetical protein